MTLHPELAALLAAIAAEPDDDTPRLVTADFLREPWQPEEMQNRGEFITVQVELAKLQASAKQDRFDYHGGTAVLQRMAVDALKLRRREKELWARWGVIWLAPNPLHLLDSIVPMQDRLEWRRGFPSRVTCGWEWGSRHLDSILADPWVPGLDEVELTSRPDANALRSMWHERGRIGLSPDWELRLLSLSWPKKVRSWKLPPEPREYQPRDFGHLFDAGPVIQEPRAFNLGPT